MNRLVELERVLQGKVMIVELMIQGRPSGGKETAKEVTFALADSDLKKAQGSSRTR